MHTFIICSHARPTFCNVCREALNGVTSHGLSCESNTILFETKYIDKRLLLNKNCVFFFSKFVNLKHINAAHHELP